MINIRRLAAIVSATALVTGLVLQVAPAGRASAAQITNRSLTLQAGLTDGGSMAGGVVNHYFQFTLPTTGNVGAIRFEYCTTAADDVAIPACVMPTGLVTTSATLGSENGATGFTMVNTTNGKPYLTRTATSVTGPQAVQYQLGNITNPTTENETFYVRITTYAATTPTGGITDSGTVNASTATQIVLTGTMPESLVFCTGEEIFTNVGGVPDCATATPGLITFDRLFSSTDTSIASSQMAASTNAGFGYAVTVNGPTLTSGGNTITAMNSSTTGVHGLSQFGLNLKANTTASSTPAIGTEIAPASGTTGYNGQAAAGYNTVDNFKFTTGDVVANSNSLGTNAQIYTASYIVNVPGSQPAGTYTTTLTYICTPTF